MPTPIEQRLLATSGLRVDAAADRARPCSRGSLLLLAGCGEPSVRELKNRRELEALLTAISLKNKKELDKDVQRIEERHASGELSDARLQGPPGDHQEGPGRRLGRGRETGV